MRGMTAIHAERLYANRNVEEESISVGIRPNGIGFTVKANGTDFNGNNYSYAYIAIRRPHKPAESGADVLSLSARSERAPQLLSQPARSQLTLRSLWIVGHIRQSGLRECATIEPYSQTVSTLNLQVFWGLLDRSLGYSKRHKS